ncbi:MAG: DUF3828 domain-containing protein [Bacteroidota bacterium]
MKTKKIIFYLLIIAFFSSMTICLNAQTIKNTKSNVDYSEQQILNMLKSFYTDYITLNSNSDSPKTEQTKNDSILRKYCTMELLKSIGDLSIDELDYDPFLNAQYFDAEWLKTIAIKKDSNRNDLYDITIYKSGSKEKVEINLTIVIEKECYKIGCITVNKMKIGCS